MNHDFRSQMFSEAIFHVGMEGIPCRSARPRLPGPLFNQLLDLSDGKLIANNSFCQSQLVFRIFFAKNDFCVPNVNCPEATMPCTSVGKESILQILATEARSRPTRSATAS